ncbi:hypothetical protein, partial [Turicimonas muris]|uniref:hypothetical protein n=1 Tax=Turicimonas muris TaxID=1796652 RepID=UPI0026EF6CAD
VLSTGVVSIGIAHCHIRSRRLHAGYRWFNACLKSANRRGNKKKRCCESRKSKNFGHIHFLRIREIMDIMKPRKLNEYADMEKPFCMICNLLECESVGSV